LLRGPSCSGDSNEQPADAADDQDRRKGLRDEGVGKTDEKGSIIATAMAPKMIPATIPNTKGDMMAPPW
jgi:hypothetical protein